LLPLPLLEVVPLLEVAPLLVLVLGLQRLLQQLVY
jgi:hypothetical protein